MTTMELIERGIGHNCLSDAYDLGRADMKKEIEEHSVFYSNRPIEDIVLEARNDAIDECAELFAETLSNMTQICGNNCPVKCNWGTEETCKDMCKKWFIEQLKEQKE